MMGIGRGGKASEGEKLKVSHNEIESGGRDAKKKAKRKRGTSGVRGR